MSPVTSQTPRYRLSALFLIAVLFAWLAPIFWQRVEIRLGSVGGTYENSDLYQVVYPSFEYGFGQLRQGRLPLWNPTQLCGTPYQTDPQAGLFQPLNFLFLVFPTTQAMALHAFLCLFLMGAFFALFVRSLGVRYVSALLGGIVYGFSGAAAAAMSRPDTAAALAWAPFLFWATSEYGRRFRWAMAFVAGGALGLLILSGAYAAAAALLCLWAPFLLWVTLFPGPGVQERLLRRAAGIPVIIATALAVSAIQWLPTVLWLKGLHEPWAIVWGLRIAAEMPTTVRELLSQLLTSTPDSLPRLAYVGVSVLPLLPASLVHRGRWREALFFFVGGGALLTFLLLRQSLIPAGMPFAALMFPVGFCVASLAALGLDRILMPRRDHRSPGIWLPALLVLAAALGLSLVAESQGRGYVMVFVCILLPFLLTRARILASLCGLGLACLAIIDFSVASVNTYRHPYQDAPGCYQREQAVVDFARHQALGGRVLISSRDVDLGLPANTGMLTGLPVAGAAYLPLTTEETIWWRNLAPERMVSLPSHLTVSRDAPRPGLLDFMATRFVVATADSSLYGGEWAQEGPRLRLGQEGANVRMFVNEGAFPRAYWTSSWQRVDGVAEAVEALGGESVRASKGCIIDSASPGVSDLTRVENEGGVSDESSIEGPSCSVEDVSAERVIVRVQAPAEGVTVLADTWAPGWSARLDNEPCPILRANGIFRGVVTPPGTHEIVFEYEPPGFGVGRIISLITLSVLGLGGLVAFARSL